MENKLILVTSILHNEIVYIDEWITFHLKQGADIIYIYVSYKEDESKNDTLFNTIVEQYKNDTNIIFNYQKHYDFVHIREFVTHEKSKYPDGWLSVLDVDEFLYSPIKDKYIKDIIYEYDNKDISAVLVNWKCFGSNNLDAKPENVLPSYTKCADDKNGINFECKSIIKISAIKSIWNSHMFHLNSGLDYYTSSGVNQNDHNLQYVDIMKSKHIDYIKEVFNKNSTPITYKRNDFKHFIYPENTPRLVINHYIIRSKEEYVLKIKNNPQRPDRYNINIFNNINKVSNTDTNTDILMKI
jgi:hypothetical protein